MTRTKKIFVGGLSVNTTIEDVKQYFDQFGKVSVRAAGLSLRGANLSISRAEQNRHED